MITSNEQFDQSLEVLASMYRALAALRRDVLPRGEQQFAVMAQAPLDEIRRIESDIADYAGRYAAEVGDADVWLGISGADISWPEVPGSILENFLGKFRKGISAVAEWLHSGALSTRPTDDILYVCDLDVVCFQPGSVRVGLRLPSPEFENHGRQSTVSEDIPTRALDLYVKAAAWASSDADESQMDTYVQDERLRRVLLTEVKRLLPGTRGRVEAVELFGRCVPGQNIRLTRSTHERVDRFLAAPLREQRERHSGDLREIDLDNLTFRLRNAGTTGGEISCKFERELLDLAIDALDRRVEVTGTRSIHGGRSDHWSPLNVLSLEVLDEFTEQTEE